MTLRGIVTTTLKTTAVVGAVGAGCVAYAAAVEVRWFTLRRVTVPVLPEGSGPLRVLHLSDLHLMADPGAQDRLGPRPGRAPARPDRRTPATTSPTSDSVRPLLRAYGDLLDVPGVFVFGSNDYWKPHFKNPGKYLLPAHKQRHKPHGPELPCEEMRARVHRRRLDRPEQRQGDAQGQRPAAGLRRHRRPAHQARPVRRGRGRDRPDGRPVRSASRTRRTSASWTASSATATPWSWPATPTAASSAVPFYGALVTNCDLDTSRVKGLSTGATHGRQAALHVSAGLGTSPYAPVRFACRPEATLLTLVPRNNRFRPHGRRM